MARVFANRGIYLIIHRKILVRKYLIDQAMPEMIFYFIIRLALAALFFALFMVATQDFHIFPGLYSSKIFGYKNSPPNDVEEYVIESTEGYKATIWRVSAKENPKPRIAILFHGNAENLGSFLQFQYWLSSLGYTSYSVEYRGYSGRNSGWPSEQGFYDDASAAYEFIVNKENITAQDMIALGSSIGSGVAAYLAQKYDIGTLVLLAPYTSLKDLVSEITLFRYLAPFLKYTFPVKEYIKNLESTCVIAAHGKRDGTIPFSHSLKLKERYSGTGIYNLIESESAGHNDLILLTADNIAEAISNC